MRPKLEVEPLESRELPSGLAPPVVPAPAGNPPAHSPALEQALAPGTAQGSFSPGTLIIHVHGGLRGNHNQTLVTGLRKRTRARRRGRGRRS
jgi:hypothetical protein